MIPWDFNKVDEHYYYPPEEYRYSHVEANNYADEEIVTYHLTDIYKIPHFNDSNYLFGYFNSD